MAEAVQIGQRTPFSGAQLRWLAGLLLGGEALGIAVAVATQASVPALSNAFATGSATLVFGALLGGVVSLLLADLDRHRLARAAELEYVANVLDDLKSVYDQVDRSRTLITAHQSAKTYGDEMRNVIQSRVTLLQVLRALNADPRRRQIVSIRAPVATMESYLRTLIERFESDYKEISRQQSVYEARMKSALEKASLDEEPRLPANAPWDRIVTLPEIKDFLSPVHEAATARATSRYMREFVEPLDRASEVLRDALADRRRRT